MPGTMAKADILRSGAKRLRTLRIDVTLRSPWMWLRLGIDTRAGDDHGQG